MCLSDPPISFHVNLISHSTYCTHFGANHRLAERLPNNTMSKALCYKPASCWFESNSYLCLWDVFL